MRAELLGHRGEVDPHEPETLCRKRLEPGKERRVLLDRAARECRAVGGEIGRLLGEGDTALDLRACEFRSALGQERVELGLAVGLEQDDHAGVGGDDEHDLRAERGRDVRLPVEAPGAEDLVDRAADSLVVPRDPLPEAFRPLPLRRVVVGRQRREGGRVGGRETRGVGHGAHRSAPSRRSRRAPTWRQPGQQSEAEAPQAPCLDGIGASAVGSKSKVSD